MTAQEEFKQGYYAAKQDAFTGMKPNPDGKSEDWLAGYRYFFECRFG